MCSQKNLHSLRCHNMIIVKKLTSRSHIDVKPSGTSKLSETADDSVDEHFYLLEDQSKVDKYFLFFA